MISTDTINENIANEDQDMEIGAITNKKKSLIFFCALTVCVCLCVPTHALCAHSHACACACMCEYVYVYTCSYICVCMHCCENMIT